MQSTFVKINRDIFQNKTGEIKMKLKLSDICSNENEYIEMLPVVNFIVAEVFEKSVGYLSKTQTFLMIHDEGYNWYPVQHYTSNFVVTHGADDEDDLLIRFLRLD